MEGGHKRTRTHHPDAESQGGGCDVAAPSQPPQLPPAPPCANEAHLESGLMQVKGLQYLRPPRNWQQGESRTG